MKNLCDETSWTDNRTRQLCLEPETASDLLGNDEDRLFAYLPVISLRTNVTYNNIYCARCNNDDQRTIFWSFQFTNSCRLHRPSSDASNDDDEHSNLLKQTSARGYSDDEYEYDEEETIRFSGLYINVPDDFALTTRKCVPGMKSSCPVATSDDVLRKNCSSYTEIVRDSSNGNVFRNEHCALCNGVASGDLAKEWCGNFSGQFPTNNARSFSSLFHLKPCLLPKNREKPIDFVGIPSALSTA